MKIACFISTVTQMTAESFCISERHLCSAVVRFLKKVENGADTYVLPHSK